jgi:hypothetical protein
MGLLDKANDTGANKAEPALKAKPKAVGIAKAKPAKAVKAAKPARAAKAAKPARAAKIAKEPKSRRPLLNNQGLPDGYEIASKNARFLSAVMNFIVNFGVLFGALFLSVVGSNPTLPAVGALLMLSANLIVIPTMTGRTLGNFISRTRPITAQDEKPNFMHGLLANSVGLFALVGVSLILFSMPGITDSGGKPQPIPILLIIFGIALVFVRIVDGRFKKNSDQSQGLYDMLFGAFLVKYVPVEGEEMSGLAARLNRMGSYGDSFTQRREAAMEKKAQKEAKLAEDAEGDDAKPTEAAPDKTGDEKSK